MNNHKKPSCQEGLCTHVIIEDDDDIAIEMSTYVFKKRKEFDVEN